MKTLRFLLIGTMAVLLSCFASSCKKGGHPDNFPEGCPNFTKHAYAGDLVDAMAPGIYEFKLSETFGHTAVLAKSTDGGVFWLKDIEYIDPDHTNIIGSAIYFGFSRCPWCRDLMPVLNQAAKKTGNKTVYYADTRANKEWKSNIDMDDYDLLVDMAFDYLPYDENNIKHLDAPTVYFVKAGKIQEAVFAPEYDATKETIPDSLREKLMADLTKAFKALK